MQSAFARRFHRRRGARPEPIPRNGMIYRYQSPLNSTFENSHPNADRHDDAKRARLLLAQDRGDLLLAEPAPPHLSVSLP